MAWSNTFLLISSSTGLLKHKTRVLVTHSTSILPQCDHIIVIKEGYIVEQGSFNQLQKEGGHFAEYLYQHAQVFIREARTPKLCLNNK